MATRRSPTPTQRADRLVAMWDRNDITLGDDLTVRANIVSEIEDAQLQTATYLSTRNVNLHARLECAVAAIRELRLKDAVRQSVTKDWYRNVAGRGVRLGLAALKEYAQSRSEQIRHETRAKR